MKMTETDLSRLRLRLDGLRENLKRELSPFRFAHILGVEQTAVRMGRVYLPGEENELLLRAAALLHDMTKELSAAGQREILASRGEKLTPAELAADKTLHAVTAALLIPERYPELAFPRVIGAVRRHTTGRADMTTEEKIVYLADYIEETRKYPDCVRLRETFWGADPASMTAERAAAHLDAVLAESFRVTLAGLIAQSRAIHPDTVEAYNCYAAAPRGTDKADGGSDGVDGGSDGADGGSDKADGGSDKADGGSDKADGG